jgi:hypothetical protein
MANAAVADRTGVTLIKPDKDANEIGRLYRLASGSLVESMRHAFECGKKLAKKRADLKHGEWLPWLEANADALGFENRRTASRLIGLAEGTPAPHLDEATAASVSRKLWGHKSREAGNGTAAPATTVEAKTQLIAALARVADFCGQNDPTTVASGMQPDEVATLQSHARVIDAWLGKFIGQL